MALKEPQPLPTTLTSPSLTVHETVTTAISLANSAKDSLSNDILTPEGRTNISHFWGEQGKTLLQLANQSHEVMVTYEPAVTGIRRLPWESITFSFGESTCTIPLMYVAADQAEQQAIRARFGPQN